MKTIFIPAYSKAKVNREEINSFSKKLPKNLAIVYSVQYKNQASEIKSLLSGHNVTAFIQVLGCSKPKFPKNTEALLLIGSGRFHALSLASETKLPIYILEEGNLLEISQENAELFKKKQKASYLRFLNSDNAGIIISTKPGQQRLVRALALRKKLKKNSYLFIADSINKSEFENFGLNCWINTACPRLDMDTNVINISEVE